MRLLPVGPDHGGCGAPRGEAQADGRGHRCRDDQRVPLRNLPAHPRRRAPCGGDRRQDQGVSEETIMKKTTSVASLSRRKFILHSAAAASGGLALGLRFPLGPGEARAADAASGAEVNAWVVVNPDDSCAIRIARSEMGQGTHTGLAQLVVEELECDWSKISLDFITAGQNLARQRVWGEMGTGGSRGIRTSQDYIRRGGAAARQMLLQAAADEWKVPVSEL